MARELLPLRSVPVIPRDLPGDKHSGIRFPHDEDIAPPFPHCELDHRNRTIKGMDEMGPA
jgi:hypothetical protein